MLRDFELDFLNRHGNYNTQLKLIYYFNNSKNHEIIPISTEMWRCIQLFSYVSYRIKLYQVSISCTWKYQWCNFEALLQKGMRLTNRIIELGMFSIVSFEVATFTKCCKCKKGSLGLCLVILTAIFYDLLEV